MDYCTAPNHVTLSTLQAVAVLSAGHILLVALCGLGITLAYVGLVAYIDRRHQRAFAEEMSRSVSGDSEDQRRFLAEVRHEYAVLMAKDRMAACPTQPPGGWTAETSAAAQRH